MDLGRQIMPQTRPGSSDLEVVLKKTLGVVVLAAGKGTRLKTPQSKPLVPLLGKRMIDFVLDEVQTFSKGEGVEASFSVVVGYQKEELLTHLETRSALHHFESARQVEQNGTADALSCFFDQVSWSEKTDYTLITCADTPLVDHALFKTLWSRINEGDLKAVAASFIAKDPYGYGRIVRHSQGFQIIEEKNADDKVTAINEVNSGIYLVKTDYLLNKLRHVKLDEVSGEFYLTDIFLAGEQVDAICFNNREIFLGVNDLSQLATAENYLFNKKRAQLQKQGVRLVDSASTYIDWDVEIGEGTIVHPHCHILKGSKIGNHCTIEPSSLIENSEIKDQACIRAFSHLDSCLVGESAVIGPYARLRPGADLGKNTKIGNFVEIKKSKLDEGSKASHLAYIGDAEIGKHVNIGCGVITANYDGKNKFKTKIGDYSFVGSDSQLVAPVELGEGSFVACGSTVTDDVPDDALAIARSRQVTKDGLAKRFIDKSKK